MISEWLYFINTLYREAITVDICLLNTLSEQHREQHPYILLNRAFIQVYVL